MGRAKTPRWKLSSAVRGDINLLREVLGRDAANREMKPYRGPPMTLESAAAAKLRLVVWCKGCGHRSEPDPAEQARWYRAETPVPRMAPAAGLLAMWQPPGRYGGDRDEAVRKAAGLPPLRSRRAKGGMHCDDSI
jgi:hypothetical protein